MSGGWGAGRSGELIELPNNPVTGRPVTEFEFRQLVSLYLPGLIQQYGERSLAEYCPVSCVTETWVNQLVGYERTNRCELAGAESCVFEQQRIEPPQQICDSAALVPIAGTCTTESWRTAGFCASSCRAQVLCSCDPC